MGVLTLSLEPSWLRSCNSPTQKLDTLATKLETTTGSASMAVDTGCLATVDIRVCSLSVDTSLYPVTLPGAISMLRLEVLQVPFVAV